MPKTGMIAPIIGAASAPPIYSADAAPIKSAKPRERYSKKYPFSFILPAGSA